MSEDEMTNEAEKEVKVSKPKSADSRKKAGIVTIDWHEELAKAKEEGRVEDQGKIEEILRKIKEVSARRQSEAGAKFRSEQIPLNKNDKQAPLLAEDETNIPSRKSRKNWAGTFSVVKKRDIIIDKFLRFLKLK